MIKNLICEHCNNGFTIEIIRGQNLPKGCSIECTKAIQNKRRNERRRKANKEVIITELHKFRKSKKEVDFTNDPNMEYAIYC
jgi:hypothetical protein